MTTTWTCVRSILAPLILLPFVFLPGRTYARAPLGKGFLGDGKSYYFNTPDNSPSLIEILKSSKRATSVEQFIAALPPALRTNYVLMHTSGSLQEGSFENPRAILFTQDARTVVSFNGNTGQVGGDRVEAIDFDYNRNKYDFYEISFTASGSHAKKNPKVCMNCHTEQLIPNWRPYQQWNGAFASSGNSFDGEVEYFVSKQNPFKPTEASWEIEYKKENEFSRFVEFRRNQHTHPRYKHLIQPQGEPYWPFAPTSPEFKTDDFDYSPLRRLGIGLTFHHSKIVSTLLLQSTLFRDYPASVISSLLLCDLTARSGGPTSFTPNSVIPSGFLKSVLDLMDSQPRFTSGQAIYERARNSSRQFDQQEILAQIFAVAGLHPELWWTDLYSRDNGLQEVFSLPSIGFYANDTIQAMVAMTLLQNYPLANFKRNPLSKATAEKLREEMGMPISLIQRIHQMVPLATTGDLKKICANLDSLKESENKSQTSIEFSGEAPSQSRPYVLRQCIACHVDGGYATAPYIPFDDSEKLASRLRENHFYLLNDIEQRVSPGAHAQVRMPKGPRGLNPTQSKKLVEYLRNLAK